MRSTLWLFMYLLKFCGKKSSSLVGNLRFRTLFRGVLLERLLVYGINFVMTCLKMRVHDVPGEVPIADLEPGSVVGPEKFHFVDPDFNKETVFKNFKAPSVGKYKIVSFHNGYVVPIMEVLAVALFARWKLANTHEVLSVAKSVDLKKLGLGDDYYLVATGTIIRRSTAAFSICCPVVQFRTIEKESTKENRIFIYLHELPGGFSNSCHVLFRVG